MSESETTFYPDYVGKTVKEIKIEALWTDGDRGDYDRLTITFTDGTKKAWFTNDASGYQSWFNDEEDSHE